MNNFSSTKYTILGNGHLRHTHKNFVDWVASDWVKKTAMDSHFSMSEGIVTIKETGLYYIYAQVGITFSAYINRYRISFNK